MDVIKSLEKTFLIMDAIADNQEGRSLSDLAKLTGMPRATVHRLLWTMTANNVIRYSQETKTYMIGVKTLEWGQNVMKRYDWRSALEPYLDSLEAETQLKVSATVGRVCPPHRGILGKILMAYLPAEAVDELLLTNPLDHLTDCSIISTEDLHQIFASVRRDGYLVAHDQTITGISGVGAPIFDRQRNVVAAIGLLAPSSSLTEECVELYRKRLLEVTNAIAPHAHR